jgi:hypothetical protein
VIVATGRGADATLAAFALGGRETTATIR